MRQRPKPNSTPDDLAFGVNAVEMALDAGVVRRLLYLAEATNPRVRDLVDRAHASGVPVEAVPLYRLDELTAGGVHQGIVVRLQTLPTVDLRQAARAPGPGLAVVLDHITDPQNLGAILRTAVAVSASVVVVPQRRGAGLTPGVHRASAGLSFFAPIATPQNLALALATVKDAGYWVVAAAAGDEAGDATAFDWPEKTALVLGSEGEGVSSLLLREADFRVALPMDERVESLNVGVAFGALAYLYRRQWPAGSSAGNR